MFISLQTVSLRFIESYKRFSRAKAKLAWLGQVELKQGIVNLGKPQETCHNNKQYDTLLLTVLA